MDIIERIFPTEESLQELRDNYEKELTFASSKLSLKQVESVVAYQKAVVDEESMERFVLLMALGQMGVKGMTTSIKEYLTQSNVGITYTHLNNLDDEVLDND